MCRAKNEGDLEQNWFTYLTEVNRLNLPSAMFGITVYTFRRRGAISWRNRQFMSNTLGEASSVLILA